MSDYLFFDGQHRVVPIEDMGVEVFESLKLDELVRFCHARGIPLSQVEISSAGDPYLPTPVTWFW